MRIMTCCYFLVVDSRLPLAIIIFCRSRLPPPPQVGTAEQAAFIDAIVSSTDSVTSADQVSVPGCTDTDRRRRQLMATTDTVDIASEITIEENSDGTAAATLTAEVIAAVSDGTFGSAVVANSGSTSVLATATVESVGAVEVEEDDDDDDDGLTGAGIVLIILAAIALIIGAYLIFLKEGFCFNTGPKAEAGGQEMVAAKANGVNVAI